MFGSPADMHEAAGLVLLGPRLAPTQSAHVSGLPLDEHVQAHLSSSPQIADSTPSGQSAGQNTSWQYAESKQVPATSLSEHATAAIPISNPTRIVDAFICATLNPFARFRQSVIASCRIRNCSPLPLGIEKGQMTPRSIECR